MFNCRLHTNLHLGLVDMTRYIVWMMENVYCTVDITVTQNTLYGSIFLQRYAILQAGTLLKPFRSIIRDFFCIVETNDAVSNILICGDSLESLGHHSVSRKHFNCAQSRM